MDEPDIPFDLDGPSTSAQAAEDAARPEETLAISSGFDKRKVWLVKVRFPSLTCNTAASESFWSSDAKLVLPRIRYPSSCKSGGRKSRRRASTSPQ